MDPSQDAVIRIALLGADDTTPALVEAILANNRFELAGVCELDDGGDAQIVQALRMLTGFARRLDAWEELLDLRAIDAVVVARGRDEDARAEQLRKLIQAGVPLLVSHSAVDSMLVYYELDMIRRETLCVLVPHLSERHHPALRQFGEMVAQGDDSPIGKIEQIVVDRCIAGPAKANVVRQFARDADVVRAIAGDMTRLGALAGASGDSAYSSLGVQMSGPGGVVARWSVVPSRGDHGARVTIVGTHGKATVEMRPPIYGWILELTTDAGVEQRSYDAWNPAAASLDQLVRAIEGQPPQPDWVDAARGVELAETIQRSLAKGRTIELYYEEYTEEGTFKGTMTSIGCGLLLLAMFLMGAVAIGEQMGLPYVRFWPYFLVGALALFLLLQLLMLVFRRPAEKSAEAPLPEPVGSRSD